MIYRKWNYGDLLAVTKLEEKCFAGERWNYKMFASSFMQDGFFGVLCEDEDENGYRTLVAYGCVQGTMETADVMNVAVAPEYRRQGYAKEILRLLTEEAQKRGIKKLFLEVRVKNEPAQKLYESQGFTALSARKKYYPDGEDAMVMIKQI